MHMRPVHLFELICGEDVERVKDLFRQASVRRVADVVSSVRCHLLIVHKEAHRFQRKCLLVRQIVWICIHYVGLGTGVTHAVQLCLPGVEISNIVVIVLVRFYMREVPIEGKRAAVD